MGHVLKFCVYTASICIVLTNVYYFLNFYDFSAFKGPYNETPRTEPITIRGNEGRLGNQMFVLATLYGLAKLNKRDIAIMPKNLKFLSTYFEINYPEVDLSRFIVRNPWKLGPWLKKDDSFIPSVSNIISGNLYPTSFTFFHHVLEDIKKLFRFKHDLLLHAEGVLAHVKKLRPWTQHFVCVHVRRGDYLRNSKGGWLRAAHGREVDLQYFKESTQYYRRKYPNITFLAVSDDRKWTKENLPAFGILTLPEAKSPGHDLVVLASCNHTIMTYGTFGFWGGYLAGGEVVYFKDFVKPGSKMANIFVTEKTYPEDWTGISTTPAGFWDNYTNSYE